MPTLKTQESAAAPDSIPEQTAQALLNLRCAVDHSHDAVFITDPGGRIEFVNPAFEELTGFSSREAVGSDLGLLATEDSATANFQGVLKQVVEKGVYRGGLEFRNKNGKVIEVDLAITAVRDAETRTANLVCTGRDITKECELQAELLDARKMDALGLLAGGVAHDFNNLLMVISAYAELGLQTLYCDHPLRRNLQEILAASQRASDLTKQLLQSGRKQVAEPQLVNLNSVIERTCQLLPKAVGEDVEVRLSLETNLGNVRTDPGQIERVALNLAVNARDAMPKGGVLSIRTQSVLPSKSFVTKHPNVPAVEYVLLEVADTGQGIATEEISKIFQPFYTTKPEGKGTGLGLAMVDRMVSRSGGFIAVESQPGVGTIFQVYFPVVGRAKETRGDSLPVQSPVPGGSETILYVEDEETVRESGIEFLSSIGYKVLPAACGDEALALAKSYPGKIDVMISDVVMPRISGPRLSEQLASRHPTMKVLYVSGYSESVVRRKGVSTTDLLVQKPYPLGLLATKLRETLEQPEQVRAAVAAAR